jgi:ABC-type long-subunit fatty acid transport system fused permease/ATPase subunit
MIWREVTVMEAEYMNEAFRSNAANFYGSFADYLTNKLSDQWNVKNCTFFRDDRQNKMWAWCLFERKP